MISDPLPAAVGMPDPEVGLRVGGPPDLTHAALANEGGDSVVPEAGTGTEGHCLAVP